MEVRRGDRLIKVLGPGDSVGYLSLIDGCPHSVEVTVTEGGTGVFLDGAQFRVVLKNQPEVAITMMETLACHLRETLGWLDVADQSDY